VIVVVIVGAGAGGIILSMPHATQSSTTSSSSGGTSVSNSTSQDPFRLTYGTITVGYQGGLFQLGFTDTEGKPIVGVVAVLHTRNETVMCSGPNGSAIGFGNCAQGPGKSYTFSPASGGPFPANTTFTGYASGIGPGSAVVGQTYTLSILATYSDGTSTNSTLSVPAVSG
jgi:hypothetical protein